MAVCEIRRTTLVTQACSTQLGKSKTTLAWNTLWYSLLVVDDMHALGTTNAKAWPMVKQSSSHIWVAIPPKTLPALHLCKHNMLCVQDCQYAETAERTANT